MTVWSWVWVGWLMAFLAIETAALLNRQPGDTLSEHVWGWFAIKDRGPHWRLRRIILLGFLAWLVTHFISGGWA